MTVWFHVLGKAKTAGSKRFMGMRNGKPLILDDCAKSAAWKADVRAAAMTAYQGPPLTGPLYVEMCFALSRPNGHYGAHGIKPRFVEAQPTTRPDLLKRARAVEDACNGLLWLDDSQIVQEILSKQYSTDGRDVLAVTVRTFEQLG